MLSIETLFEQSRPAGDAALAMHFQVEAEPGYWAEIERDLAENPDIWPLREYEDLA